MLAPVTGNLRQATPRTACCGPISYFKTKRAGYKSFLYTTCQLSDDEGLTPTALSQESLCQTAPRLGSARALYFLLIGGNFTALEQTRFESTVDIHMDNT
jgi:hypothetical protein